MIVLPLRLARCMLMIQLFIYMFRIRCERSVVYISNWFSNSCLYLSIMFFFFMSASIDPEPDVIVAGMRLSVVNKFKYLGIIIKITFAQSAFLFSLNLILLLLCKCVCVLCVYASVLSVMWLCLCCVNHFTFNTQCTESLVICAYY